MRHDTAMLHAVLEGIAGAPRAAADALVRRPAAWLWQCCVRQNHAVVGPPMWLRPRGAGSGMLGAWDTTRAGELFFPLLTMSIYGTIALPYFMPRGGKGTDSGLGQVPQSTDQHLMHPLSGVQNFAEWQDSRH